MTKKAAFASLGKVKFYFSEIILAIGNYKFAHNYRGVTQE